VITKPDQHEIDRAGKRLLRDLLEPLGWVINDVQEDYGIDSNVQVFEGQHPTGTWFHVQLKSSSAPNYLVDGVFVSQELSIAHARHYALEIRDPILVIHADVSDRKAYWYAPQLDPRLATLLRTSEATSISVRIPTSQSLPLTAPQLLEALNRIYLTLANRELASASVQAFAESLEHLPDQEALYRSFHEKTDTLRLQRAVAAYKEGRTDEARIRARAIVDDPDSGVEMKFWAEIQLEAVDYSTTFRADRPQNELPQVMLSHAKELQRLTADGPNYLKFFALIARCAAELDVLVHEDSSLFFAQQQHLLRQGDPMMVLSLYAKRVSLTKRIVAKYNQCIRLARYAKNYPDRWALGRALTRIVNAMGMYLILLNREGNVDMAQQFAKSALQICKLAAWISSETQDPQGIVLSIISSLLTIRSTESEAYRWASETANSLANPTLRADALERIQRAVRRWRGERVEGDHHGDTTLQIIQNMASAYGIDMSDDNDPMVRTLKIAAKDNSPERVLINCEHLLVSIGAVGPTARKIQRLFNIGTAGAKVVHCTLHNYHHEADEQDRAYQEFSKAHCDSCPDRAPGPKNGNTPKRFGKSSKPKT
jgi:hypothetical protein